jgi:hypothetical protein
MTDSLIREIECQLCEDKFSPIIEPEEDEVYYRLYCSLCANWISINIANPVRVTLKEVMGLKGEALALAIQTCLAKCQCGKPFSHDAGGRCSTCLDKIEQESRAIRPPEMFQSPWNLEELRKFEGQILEYLMGKIASKEETLGQLIDRFENGEINAEVYMEGIESIQFRESRQMSVVQTWAMILGPEIAFRAAEEHDLVERYGSRILVSIAKGLEMSAGKSVLSTLAAEQDNWDGAVGKELRVFMKKIGGGF